MAALRSARTSNQHVICPFGNLIFSAICNSMSTCSHYTWAPASLACGLRTTPPGGMVGWLKAELARLRWSLAVLVQVDLPNIETGSPHMSGTVRDKIFVGQVSRKRNARECQEWCQVKKHSTKQILNEEDIEASQHCPNVAFLVKTSSQAPKLG